MSTYDKFKGKRVVGYLDHLGTSQKVFKEGIDVVVEAYLDTWVSVTGVKEFCAADGKGPGAGIEHFTFSDSTVLIADLRKPRDLIKMLTVMSLTFTSLLLKQGIVSRGAIAIGEMLVDSNIFVGKPLIQAVTVAEEVLDSAGLAFIMPNDSSEEVDNLNKKGWLSQGCNAVPVKKGAEDKLKRVELRPENLRMVRWFNSSLVPKTPNPNDPLSKIEGMDGSLQGLRVKLQNLCDKAPEKAKRLYTNAIEFIDCESN